MVRTIDGNWYMKEAKNTLLINRKVGGHKTYAYSAWDKKIFPEIDQELLSARNRYSPAILKSDSNFKWKSEI